MTCGAAIAAVMAGEATHLVTAIAFFSLRILGTADDSRRALRPAGPALLRTTGHVFLPFRRALYE